MSNPDSVKKPGWDVRVQQILASVRRRARNLMLLGYFIYGGGTAALLYFIPDKTLATVLVMFFFQLLVLYFGTREMYPAIQGGFRTSLEATRDSVPVFEKIAEGVSQLENDPASHPAFKEAAARVERAVEEKLMPVVNTWARIGERVEKTTLPQVEQLVAEIRDRAQKIDAKVSSTTEGVKRVQQHVEMELATGLLVELRQAADAVKILGMQHAPPPMPGAPGASARPQPGQPVRAASGRDFRGILATLDKKGNGTPVPAQGGKV